MMPTNCMYTLSAVAFQHGCSEKYQWDPAADGKDDVASFRQFVCVIGHQDKQRAVVPGLLSRSTEEVAQYGIRVSSGVAKTICVVLAGVTLRSGYIERLVVAQGDDKREERRTAGTSLGCAMLE